MSEKTAVYSQENAASGIPLRNYKLLTRVSPRSDADGGAPNYMENVMASDTSPRLYFEGLPG